MRIRAATNADAEGIRRLIETILLEYGLRPDTDGVDADLVDIKSCYIDRGGVFEVVEDEAGELIGTVGLYPLKDGVCELRKMYLLPRARGRGLGKRLMRRMFDLAKQLGFKRMELETAGVLVEAIGLYKRFGFRPIESGHLACRCDQAFAIDLNDVPTDDSASL